MATQREIAELVLRACKPCCGSGSGSGSGSGDGGSGSGDGSGSGGSGSGGGCTPNCCGCNIASFPSKLYITVDLSCAGPVTVELNRTGPGPGGMCVDDGTGAPNFSYSGTASASLVPRGGGTNCVTGLPFTAGLSARYSVTVDLVCGVCQDIDGCFLYGWTAGITYSYVSGGVLYSFQYGVPLIGGGRVGNPISCSPLVWTAVSQTVICQTDLPPLVTVDACGFYPPYTTITSTVGCVMTLNISE